METWYSITPRFGASRIKTEQIRPQVPRRSQGQADASRRFKGGLCLTGISKFSYLEQEEF